MLLLQQACMAVTYWPLPEPSIKRCTCINKQRNSGNRCIQSRMSEYHLDLWTWLNSGQMRMPTGSRWVWNNYITRCHRWLGSVGVPVAVGDKMPAWEQLADWGLAALRIHGWEDQQNEEEVLLWSKKNFGSICSSLSPSPTHLSHTRNINPIE